jgi:protein ImuB
MLWLCIRLPQLAHESSAANAQQAIERLAAWSYQWSSQVSYQLTEQSFLWLEIGASQKLFNGHTALLARIELELAHLGYTHVCAVAPTPQSSALLTWTPQPRQVFTRVQLRQRLESLPLTLLDLPAATLEGLQSAGLRRIGEVLALPAAAIARRFGPETTLYLRRLLGRATDPLPIWQLPPIYRARCEFGGELRDAMALLFPLQRLLTEFQGYLRGRDCAVLRFTLQLEHHRRPASELTIGLSAPAREATRFLQLVRERLHRLELPAPIIGLTLEALEFTAPAVVQADLFGSPTQQLQQLQLLLERLKARLGPQQILALQLHADYRPERAWRFSSADSTTADAHSITATHGDCADHTPQRPCFLATDPQPIAQPAHILSGPERIESGWWDRADTTRDYYVAQADDGARLWVFRDLADDTWYLQGLWA